MPVYQSIARVMKLAGSLGCYGATVVWEKLQRAAGKTPPGRCVVLHYHALPLRLRERFARQMDILLRCAKPLRPELTTPLSPGVLHAVVTFDDGYQSVVENALPELQKRNIPFAFFVVSHCLGRPAAWLSKEFCHTHDGDNILTAQQLRQLPSDLVSIGSHSMTHARLPSLSQEVAKRELTDSRATLEQVSQRRVTLFSFPHGAFNDSLLKWCREVGYERVFSIEPIMAHPQEDIIGRVSADAGDWNLEFRLKLHGGYRWLPTAFACKRRILGVLKPALGRSH